MRIRTRPETEEFEAFQLTAENMASQTNWPDWARAAWMPDDPKRPESAPLRWYQPRTPGKAGLAVRTRAGELRARGPYAPSDDDCRDNPPPAREGDWILRNRDGFLSVMSHEDFARRFDTAGV